MTQMNPDRSAARLGLSGLICGLLSFLLLFGCDQKSPAPIPAASGSGQRLVSLSPALAIIVRDLGAADRFVGRDGNDMVLPKSLPVCGDLRSVELQHTSFS